MPEPRMHRCQTTRACCCCRPLSASSPIGSTGPPAMASEAPAHRSNRIDRPTCHRRLHRCFRQFPVDRVGPRLWCLWRFRPDLARSNCVSAGNGRLCRRPYRLYRRILAAGANHCRRYAPHSHALNLNSGRADRARQAAAVYRGLAGPAHRPLALARAGLRGGDRPDGPDRAFATAAPRDAWSDISANWGGPVHPVRPAAGAAAVRLPDRQDSARSVACTLARLLAWPSVYLLRRCPLLAAACPYLVSI